MSRYGVLPCPFCGANPVLEPWHGAPWLLGCDNEACEAAPHVTGYTRAEAVERWNRRHQPTKQAPGRREDHP